MRHGLKMDHPVEKMEQSRRRPGPGRRDRAQLRLLRRDRQASAAVELAASGRPAAALVSGFPAYTLSQAGWCGRATIDAPLPPDGPARLEVVVGDNCPGTTFGYHFAAIRVNGARAWERDVSAATLGPAMAVLDLRKPTAGSSATIELTLEERQAVSSFPVAVTFTDPRLVTARGTTRLLPQPAAADYLSLPPDPPLTGPPLAGDCVSDTDYARAVS